MATVEFDLSGLITYAARLRLQAASVHVQAAAVIRAGAEDAERLMRDRVHVSSGATRNSIGTDYSDGGLTATIGPTDPAAPYEEYGTSDTPPHPFVGPAMDIVRHRVHAELAALASRTLT